MIKEADGKLLTERGAVLKVWEGYFKLPANWNCHVMERGKSN